MWRQPPRLSAEQSSATFAEGGPHNAVFVVWGDGNDRKAD
jgi:hypothetical protein